MEGLLELNHVLRANSECMKQVSEQTAGGGNIDYRKLYLDWSRWFEEYAGEIKSNGLR